MSQFGSQVILPSVGVRMVSEQGTPPSLWRSPSFYLILLCVTVVVIVTAAFGCSRKRESEPRYAQAVCTARNHVPSHSTLVGKTVIVHPAQWHVTLVLMDASTEFRVDDEAAYRAADGSEALLVEFVDLYDDSGKQTGRRFRRAFPIPCVTSSKEITP